MSTDNKNSIIRRWCCLKLDLGKNFSLGDCKCSDIFRIAYNSRYTDKSTSYQLAVRYLGYISFNFPPRTRALSSQDSSHIEEQYSLNSLTQVRIKYIKMMGIALLMAMGLISWQDWENPRLVEHLTVWVLQLFNGVFPGLWELAIKPW